MPHRAFLFVLFGTFLFAYSYVHRADGWNQVSRLDLLHALVQEHTIRIDSYHENTQDKAFVRGHYYSEKAPGIVVLAIPAFVFSSEALKAVGMDIDSPRGWLLSSWITTVGSVGILTALGAVALYLLLLQWVEARIALMAIFALFLGSLPFPYATMLFSHAAVAGLLAIALWALFADMIRGVLARWNIEIAGLCCGFAVASEYPFILIVGCIFVVLLVEHRCRALRFALAASLPMLLIPLNNFLVTGSPLHLGYGQVALDQLGLLHQNELRIFGFGLPKFDVLFAMLFSQYRGLFFWTPFLVLTLPGFTHLYRRERKFFWCSISPVLLYSIAFSANYYWFGGAALGMRHLTPLIPLLAVPAALGAAEFRLFAGFMAAISLFLMGTATFLNTMPPSLATAPIWSHYVPLFKDGTTMMKNLGMVVGMQGLWSALPLLIVTGVSFHWLYRRSDRLEVSPSSNAC
ncbi:hypothetical protein COU80_04495 [Candidatus Peregrinibacteria bacterium CG10_big_fil_rev_8_21_14_0_10_55_24]|nr:MAG: hypothetical protein COU80_04495 [Candidatus Peregrinibacteria bacterium CG10_big_fil_rev_8_21_14_0_10_55_24]